MHRIIKFMRADRPPPQPQGEDNIIMDAPNGKIQKLWIGSSGANQERRVVQSQIIIIKSLECLHSTFRTFDCYQAFKQGLDSE